MLQDGLQVFHVEQKKPTVREGVNDLEDECQHARLCVVKIQRCGSEEAGPFH